MDLLLLGNEDTLQGDESHYVYINYFNRFMYNKTKDKNKTIFV